MKLTTKRNWRYFWRELFSYMIPMILIVWSVDVFYNFVRCPLHPEWSAPCNVNWILAAMYWFFLILVIILAIISSRKLKKIKKQIENEFLEATKHSWEIMEKNMQNDEGLKDEIIVDKVKIRSKSKPKKIIVEWDSTLKNKRKTKKFSKNV